LTQTTGQNGPDTGPALVPGGPGGTGAARPTSADLPPIGFPAKQAEPEIVDVWSRPARWYRALAVAFLLFNILLFGALGCYTYRLRTGDPYPLLRPVISLFGGDLAPPRYPYWTLWKACFDPFGPSQVTLTDFLIFPISVEQVPTQIIIVGLLMASLVTIPILVAMLYRLPVAMAFLVIVGFVAVFPWLSLTLLLSCFIATARPFKFSFRYATVLLALIPVIVYFFASTRGADDVATLAGANERMKLYAPWVLAVIASCLSAGLVLAFAYLISYRPGGIASLLAVLFAVPVSLFHTQVGGDELAYRLLEHDYGPDSRRVFVDMDPRELVERVAELEWTADAQGERRDIRALVQNKMLLLKLALPTELLRQQHEVVQQCNRFMEKHPNSRYYWNCLYLRGRAMDMRIDMELLRREALVQFYAGFPSEESRETWKELLRDNPDSPFASVAGLKLALFEAREGKLKVAENTLQRIVDTFGSGQPPPPTTAATSGLGQLFARKPAASSLNVDPKAVAEQAAQFLSLIRENQYGQFTDVVYPEHNPISWLLRCDPRHAKYPENLKHIDQWFPGSRLHDNLMVRLALTKHSVEERREALKAVIDRYRGGDAAAHAIYELGVLELNDNRKAEGIRALNLLLQEHEDSPWVASAMRKLMVIDAAPRAK